MKSRLLLVSVLLILILGGLLVPRPAQACQPVYHIVKPGENLSQIAAYYGVTVQAIVQANNLWNPNYIYVGQYLLIPVPCKPSPPTGCFTTHVVKRGEYLKVIAARYGVSVASIVSANGIQNPNLIYPGQRLKIPTACKPEPKPKPSPTGPWNGAYWNNRNLAGSPHFTRSEKAIDFNWGVASPGSGINHDNFSARWTRTRHFDAGWYRFTIRVDDGVRLWVDGKLLIDKWRDTAPTTYYVDTYLATGNHKLAVEYYEHTGGAQITLQITAISAPTPQPGPTTKPPDKTLWRGEYCSTRVWTDCCCPTIKYEPHIFFDWGPDAPWPGFRKDDFAVRWTRDVYFDAGTYRFTADVDDGVVVLIDGNAIITQWYDTNGRVFHSDQKISQGTHHIEVQYYEALNDARIKFFWTRLP